MKKTQDSPNGNTQNCPLYYQQRSGKEYTTTLPLIKDDDILIEDKPLIFIRKKETGIVKAIDSIAEKIENTTIINGTMASMVL